MIHVDFDVIEECFIIFIFVFTFGFSGNANQSIFVCDNLAIRQSFLRRFSGFEWQWRAFRGHSSCLSLLLHLKIEEINVVLSV